MIDTPARHWDWMLEDACYGVERGVRLLADVEVPEIDVEVAVAEVEKRGLLTYASAAGPDPAGIDTVLVYVAREMWVLVVARALFGDGEVDTRMTGALLGVLHGYDGAAVQSWWDRTTLFGGQVPT